MSDAEGLYQEILGNVKKLRRWSWFRPKGSNTGGNGA